MWALAKLASPHYLSESRENGARISPRMLTTYYHPHCDSFICKNSLAGVFSPCSVFFLFYRPSFPIVLIAERHFWEPSLSLSRSALPRLNRHFRDDATTEALALLATVATFARMPVHAFHPFQIHQRWSLP